MYNNYNYNKYKRGLNMDRPSLNTPLL